MGTANWLVTNGKQVVGPLPTGVLLQALARGLLGPDSLVRQPAWAAWRPLSQVREAESWLEGAEVSSAEAWLSQATDRAELGHFALAAALRITAASRGAVHMRRGEGMVTSCVAGMPPEQRLGRVVEPQDPTLHVARTGAVYLGDVPQGAPEAVATAQRLGGEPEPIAVAMLPLLGCRRLLGMVELARSDHPFRASDRALLERIAWGVRLRTL